jgi:hypothetical protein
MSNEFDARLFLLGAFAHVILFRSLPHRFLVAVTFNLPLIRKGEQVAPKDQQIAQWTSIAALRRIARAKSPSRKMRSELLLRAR